MPRIRSFNGYFNVLKLTLALVLLATTLLHQATPASANPLPQPGTPPGTPPGSPGTPGYENCFGPTYSYFSPARSLTSAVGNIALLTLQVNTTYSATGTAVPCLNVTSYQATVSPMASILGYQPYANCTVFDPFYLPNTQPTSQTVSVTCTMLPYSSLAGAPVRTIAASITVNANGLPTTTWSFF